MEIPPFLFSREGAVGIRYESVSKRYGDVRAVDGVDLEVRPGELFALIGPSGSGKTTLLRMVNRLVAPDEGWVLVGGEDVALRDPIALRRSIGYVIQEIGLFPHMTVSENVGIIPSLSGMPRAEREERVRSLLSLVRLPPETYARRYPRELSGGQQQRVGLARALAMDPPILLMDEPFGALDPVLRRELQEEFLALKRGLRRTIVFVTHDVGEAFLLGDRVGVMAGGRLLRFGTPAELVLEPGPVEVEGFIGAAERARFLGELPVGILAARPGPEQVVDSRLPVREARAKMLSLRVPCLVAARGGAAEGVVTPREILAAGDEEVPLEEVAVTVPAFDPATPAREALATMRERGAAFALVPGGGDELRVLSMEDLASRLLWGG